MKKECFFEFFRAILQGSTLYYRNVNGAASGSLDM